MSTLIHWSAFDDSEWACGSKWPEPISLRPFLVGPDAPECSTDPKRATCPGCKAFVARLYAFSSPPAARSPQPASAGSPAPSEATGVRNEASSP